MSSTIVITDSAACLPASLAQTYHVQIVPYQLIWDGQTFLDGRDITAEAFYRRLRTAHSHPTTATPAPGQFVAAYRAAAEEADAIVAIVTTRSLTATVDAAQASAQEAGLQERVVVVDSGTAGPAQAFIVLAAARAAQQGAAAQEVVAVAQQYRQRINQMFSLDDLSYLQRGGRIGLAASLLGSKLRIHPVLTLAQGVVRPVAIARTQQSALERIVARMRDAVGARPVRAAVLHADRLHYAERLCEQVKREFHCIEHFIADFTPVMGAHTGPGVVGVAYCLED